VSFRQSEFPGSAGVLDRREGDAAGAAVVTAMGRRPRGLGHSGGEVPTPHLRDKFHANAGVAIEFLRSWINSRGLR